MGSTNPIQFATAINFRKQTKKWFLVLTAIYFQGFTLVQITQYNIFCLVHWKIKGASKCSPIAKFLYTENNLSIQKTVTVRSSEQNSQWTAAFRRLYLSLYSAKIWENILHGNFKPNTENTSIAPWTDSALKLLWNAAQNRKSCLKLQSDKIWQ